MKPDFTIGMACYENFEEVFFTVQALRLYNWELMGRWEILIVDNSPGTREGKAVEALINGRVKENGRYIAWDEVKGSVPPRAKMIDEARGKFVVCIDSHVLLAPGCLQALTDYFDANPECNDLIHGPLLSNFIHSPTPYVDPEEFDPDNTTAPEVPPMRLEGSHMVPQWRKAMFGTWGQDARWIGSEPFEIPQHGLGLFAVRKASWLRFHPGFRGFSGGEGYIHEKYRQAGRKVLCLPGAKWLHKFSRPNGIPHRPTVDDKIRNHILGWSELGVDLETGSTENPIESIEEHFVNSGKVSAGRFERLAAEAGVEGYKVRKPAISGGLVFGQLNLGSFRMRGIPVANESGARLIDSREEYRGRESLETVLAVKSEVPSRLREKAKRLIVDPVDLWYSSEEESAKTPAKWLADFYARNKFDEIIVSTIPMMEATKRGLPKTVKVHLVPHHADPRIGLDWYDPQGPIVYAGSLQFVFPVLNQIRAACRNLGREFVINHQHHSWKALQGASLVLAPRAGGRTRLNLECKPTVKIANASQAGIPCLATDDLAITTLFPDVHTVPLSTWEDAGKLEIAIQRASDSPHSAIKFPYEDWLSRMSKVTGW